MSQNEIDHRLADKVETFGIEVTDGFNELVEDALREAERQLQENRDRVTGPTAVVEDVLDPDNVRDVDVRNPGWQNPTVTVWLQNCPHYANWAGSRKLIRTDVRGDLHYTLDVRPF